MLDFKTLWLDPKPIWLYYDFMEDSKNVLKTVNLNKKESDD